MDSEVKLKEDAAKAITENKKNKTWVDALKTKVKLFQDFLEKLWDKTVKFFKCVYSTIKLIVSIVKNSIWNIFIDKLKSGN